ncbi:MAG: protein translocase subunit SecF [Acidipila sp.]|nr:protein translocase subunit SecF [Acidipila sp.]
MEIFHQVNIDWMGKAKYFAGLSVLLLLVGWASIWHQGGLRYGIDFREGTMVTVGFAQEPSIDVVRKGLAAEGLGNSTIQQIHDITRPDTHDLVIGVDTTGDQALDTAKTAIVKALQKTFPTTDPSRADLNAVGSQGLAEALVRRDPLGYSTAAGDHYTTIAKRITDFRDSQRGGLIANLDELRAPLLATPDVQQGHGSADAVLSVLKDSYTVGAYTIRNVEIVGPKVGGELRKQALLATLYALAGMLVYIAFRFEWVYGAAAVLAVFHDVLITLGLFSIFHFEISLTVIAALLTLVGYSMNDTIVIFDRVRENTRLMRREPLAVIVNRSINQTLSRTILTSGLTFLTVLVLFVLGGETLRSFSFAMVVGIVVGTYSSFGIAAPLVVAWNDWRGGKSPVGSVARARQSEAT